METEELEPGISLVKGAGFHRTIATSVSELRVARYSNYFFKILRNINFSKIDISIFMGCFLIF